MASLYKQKTSGKVGYRIQFQGPKAATNDPRLSLWLGTNVSESFAEEVVSFIDVMVEALNDGQAFDKQTRAWIKSLKDVHHEKLAKVGLVESRKPKTVDVEEPRTLTTLVERFLKTVTRQKPATQIKLRQAGNCLTRYFGDTRKIDSITAGHADEWAVWMATHGNIREGKKRKGKDGKAIQGRTSLADSTVRRRSGLCKQILDFAVKLRWISENPFAGLVASVQPNEERMKFIDHPTINKVIEMAPDARWRGIIALARFGGLRIPSELTRLRWSDIDLETGSMRIHATKTEHHKNKGIRFCPIFPELRPYLEDLKRLANPGIESPIDGLVFPELTSAINLRSQFERIIAKAAVEQWPKLFQNLRASRETELMAIFPAKDVCTWIGNTQQIAMKHYAMATEESFRRAVKTTTLPTEVKAPPVDELPNAEKIGQDFGQNFGQSGEINSPKESSPNLPSNEKTAESQGKEGFCGAMRTGDENHQTEISGRYWTRTNDLNDVNVAL